MSKRGQSRQGFIRWLALDGLGESAPSLVTEAEPMPPALRKSLVIGLGAMLAGVAPLSQAIPATATTTFSVTANVVTTCGITATNLNFGNYSGVQLDGTSTLTTACTTGTPYVIQLHAGTAPGATTTTRKMTGPGGQLLGYGLFRDAARTMNWGEVVPRDTAFGVGSAVFTVYGRIPASQFVQAGAYSDTITVELTF
jgi:spore coat protein U-like protein